MKRDSGEVSGWVASVFELVCLQVLISRRPLLHFHKRTKSVSCSFQRELCCCWCCCWTVERGTEEGLYVCPQWIFIHFDRAALLSEPPFPSIPQVQGNTAVFYFIIIFLKSWLLFNITAYSLHLAAALTFYLELNFFHYVFFFPHPSLNPGIWRPLDIDPFSSSAFICCVAGGHMVAD